MKHATDNNTPSSIFYHAPTSLYTHFSSTLLNLMFNLSLLNWKSINSLVTNTFSIVSVSGTRGKRIFSKFYSLVFNVPPPPRNEAGGESWKAARVCSASPRRTVLSCVSRDPDARGC